MLSFGNIFSTYGNEENTSNDEKIHVLCDLKSFSLINKFLREYVVYKLLVINHFKKYDFYHAKYEK